MFINLSHQTGIGQKNTRGSRCLRVSLNQQPHWIPAALRSRAIRPLLWDPHLSKSHMLKSKESTHLSLNDLKGQIWTCLKLEVFCYFCLKKLITFQIFGQKFLATASSWPEAWPGLLWPRAMQTLESRTLKGGPRMGMSCLTTIKDT